MAGHASSNDGDTDWRRIASDRNVSHGVARALWEQARAASPDDPAQAEHAYHAMLDEAEHANATHEPGRETLAGGAIGPRDAASLGPGKWTRVLLEQPRQAASPADAIKKASAEAIRAELAAAGQAGKQAIDAIASSDPATIVAALRALGGEQTGLVGKLMAMATGAVEKILDKRDSWDGHKQPAPPAKPRREDDGSEDGDAPPAEDSGHAAPAAPPSPPTDADAPPTDAAAPPTDAAAPPADADAPPVDADAPRADDPDDPDAPRR